VIGGSQYLFGEAGGFKAKSRANWQSQWIFIKR
jgi:hypothetical protein